MRRAYACSTRVVLCEGAGGKYGMSTCHSCRIMGPRMLIDPRASCVAQSMPNLNLFFFPFFFKVFLGFWTIIQSLKTE